MKKIIATLFLVVCLVTTGFSQIVSVHKDESGAEYLVDKDSITRKEGLILFVGIVKSPDMLVLTSFGTDCRSLVIIQSRVVTEEVVITYEFRKLKPEPIIPGSRASYPINYVCNINNKLASNDLFAKLFLESYEVQ